MNLSDITKQQAIKWYFSLDKDEQERHRIRLRDDKKDLTFNQIKSLYPFSLYWWNKLSDIQRILIINLLKDSLVKGSEKTVHTVSFDDIETLFRHSKTLNSLLNLTESIFIIKEVNKNFNDI